jgi:hypothetical protein
MASGMPSGEPVLYSDRILACWNHLCSLQKDGASPAEVTNEMAKRGWLSPMDTVIDIADLMTDLRRQGRL